MCSAITPVPSQIIKVGYKGLHFSVDIDSGATVSFIRVDVVKRLNMPVSPNDQYALLADKNTRMRSKGEVDILVVEQEKGVVVLRLRALVMDNLNAECYGGQTFHLDNGVVDDVSNSRISLHRGKFHLNQSNKYGNLKPHPPPVLTADKLENRVNMSAAWAVDQSCQTDVIDKSVHEARDACENRLEKAVKRHGTHKTVNVKEEKTILPGCEYSVRIDEPEAERILIIPPAPKLNAVTDTQERPSWTPQVCEVKGGGGTIYQYIKICAIVPSQKRTFPNCSS